MAMLGHTQVLAKVALFQCSQDWFCGFNQSLDSPPSTFVVKIAPFEQRQKRYHAIWRHFKTRKI